MEAKKRPISNTLACSLVVFSFAFCFVILIHVEIELHAHRNMLQVLTLQREEGIHSRSEGIKHIFRWFEGLSKVKIKKNYYFGKY